MNKKIIINVVFFILNSIIYSQSDNVIDSLKQELKKATSEKNKIELLNELSWELSPIDFENAFLYANEALKLSKGKFKQDEATAYNRIGSAYDLHGNYPLAILNYEKSATLRLILNDSLGYSNVLLNIGALYYYQGLYNKSLEYYIKSSKIKEKINDVKGLSQLLNNIGLVYRVSKDNVNALSYFEKSLQLKKQINDLKGQVNSLSNMGIIYLNEGNCENAILYANKAYDLSLQIDSKYDIASSLANLGFAYICDSNLTQSLYYFKLAEKKLSFINDLNTQAFCFKGIGQVYNELKQFDKSILYLERAKETALLVGRKELLSEIFRLKSEVYNKIKNTDKSYESFKMHILYKDSVFSEENNRQLNEIEATYNADKKQKQIDILSKEAMIKDEQAKNNLLQRNLFVIASVFVFIVLVLVLLTLRQKQKNNKKLNEKNKLIAQSLNDKELLLKEIHHRVKNNLQIITGLLELQESLHQNKEIGNLVSEAQGRIKTMAIIHEMLYQTDDISKINLGDYIIKLINSIELGYSNHHAKVLKNIFIQQVYFNIDTIIPLGLILNELISNAFKYVYSVGKGNELSISIEQLSDIEWELIIKDDGPGIPNNGLGEREGSFGLKLVKMLSRQLKGKVDYNHNNGSVFSIIFKEQKIN